MRKRTHTASSSRRSYRTKRPDGRGDMKGGCVLGKRIEAKEKIKIKDR